MAGHGAHGLAVVEIIFEFFTRGFLPRHHLGVDFGFAPQFFAQAADEFGIFGELLHQNCACAVERGFGVGHVFVQVALRGGFGVFRRRAQQ